MWREIGRVRALLECRGDVGIGGLEGGEDAESDAADYREEKSEDGGVPVDGELGIEGRASRQARVCGDGRESPSEGESCRAAEQGKQNAFGHHLPDETEAAGADAEADSQFFAAVDAAREGHGGEIEAGDGGDDGHQRSVEAEELRANFAGDRHARARAHEDNAFRFVGLGRCEGIVFVQAAGNSVEGGLGGVDANAGSKAHEELEGLEAGVVRCVIAELSEQRRSPEQ